MGIGLERNFVWEQLTQLDKINIFIANKFGLGLSLLSLKKILQKDFFLSKIY